MARELQADFKLLLKFLSDYNIKKVITTSSFIVNLKRQHKYHYSLLSFIAELSQLAKQKNPKPRVSKKQLEFFTECCSDIGKTLFLMTHGSYKASKMLLRSSIETFLKGFNLDQIKDLDKDTSVFSIFERVKNLEFFKKSDNKKIFNSIRGEYKLLCQTVHSSQRENMSKILGLKYFPNYSSKSSQQIVRITSSLVQNYITLLCLKYNFYLHQMHYKSREVIMENTVRGCRKRIQGFHT